MCSIDLLLTMTDRFYLLLQIHSLSFSPILTALGSYKEQMVYIEGHFCIWASSCVGPVRDLQQKREKMRKMRLVYLFPWLSSCRVALGCLCPTVEGLPSSQDSHLLPTPFWILDSRFSFFSQLLDSSNCSLFWPLQACVGNSLTVACSGVWQFSL